VNTANGDAELYAVDTPLVLGKASYEAQFKRFGSDGLLTLTATDRNCVRDTHNNVFWEVKADDSSSLRSGAHKYTWFLETTDGLTGTSDSQALPVNSQGVKGSGVPCGNTLTSCNIQDYINEVNVVNLCGKNRWRLPTIEELSSLFVPVSGINTAYFPNTVRESALDSYWSSTEASDAGNAHGISFGANQVFAVPGSAPKTFPGLIRLVHDGLD
jgi:hypothetical protein